MHGSWSRLRDDWKPGSADFPKPILQLLRRRSCGALSAVTDDDFCARLAVLYEETFSDIECGEWRQQQGCKGEDDSFF